ncbi:MAG TPA: hypothetical protein VFA43_12735 [Gemmatimonadaceae bacterium]|nr:hypothetical protein [Gemmatimonadaceae bacterium]
MTRKRPWRAAGIALAALVAACNDNNNNPLQNYTPPGPPTGLVYQLNLGEQIGADSVIDPGVLLSWLPPNPDNTVNAFIVYADTLSPPDTGAFFQIAATTSFSFHDALPATQYFVASQDVNGVLSARSNIVFIDPADTVQAPSNITGTPLDSAALLQWSDNSITGPNGSRFDFYRVYSDSVDTGNNCVANTTVLEGQTVSNGFVITGVANDVPRCYFVTAVTRSGHESANSPGVIITPTSSDPPYSAARISGNYVVIAHHPLALHRSVVSLKHK